MVRANGRASGPVLTSLFLSVPDHSATVGGGGGGGGSGGGSKNDVIANVGGRNDFNLELIRLTYLPMVFSGGVRQRVALSAQRLHVKSR